MNAVSRSDTTTLLRSYTWRWHAENSNVDLADRYRLLMRKKYTPLRNYGVIGDMRSAALISLSGSLDWLCLPDFDSPSTFAAILDANKGGYWRMAPIGKFASRHSYVTDTNVLSTIFETSAGSAELVDLMPLGENGGTPNCRVLRILRGLQGSMTFRCTFAPRLDYARGDTQIDVVRGGAVASKDGCRLALSSSVEMKEGEEGAEVDFEIKEGETVPFCLAWNAAEPPNPGAMERLMAKTIERWRAIAATITYDGRWREEVRRSALALHLLVYEPTGALVAAPTTSLPEWIGGKRNWDYRFCWIRDAAYTLDILTRIGHEGETGRFLAWLSAAHLSRGKEPRTLYGLRLEEHLPEEELSHLEGYRKSCPVRIGNDAHAQRQLDIYGDAMIAYSSYLRGGGELTDDIWSAIEQIADRAVKNWNLPDCGIWEVRGPMKHFVHSKVMCWRAVDGAVALGESLERGAELERWREARDQIRSSILRDGWNEEIGSFVQFYGARHTDASLLMIPFVGFLPPTDARMRATVKRIREELEEDGLIRRYRPDRTDDGLGGGQEGAFLMCTLWLAGYLTMIGEIEEAEQMFQRVLTKANSLGLFSEMVNPQTGEMLGNFPQAFTHLSLIHTARNLDAAISAAARA
jgi:GH15 family glucan-1,4-alpha-glucosidase